MRFMTIFVLIAIGACAQKRLSLESVADRGTVDGESKRALMTFKQCQALGGIAVGDIGDGKIHRPDFLCMNKRPPLGTIRNQAGEPIAIEGSVCCGVDAR